MPFDKRPHRVSARVAIGEPRNGGEDSSRPSCYNYQLTSVVTRGNMRPHRFNLNRRQFMRVGTLALGGLTLPQLLQTRAVAGTSDPGTSVILF